MNKSFKTVLLSGIFTLSFVSVTGYAGSWAHSLYSSVRCDNDRAFCLDDGECLCVPIGTACNKQGCSKIPEEGLWYWNDDDGKWDCYNKCYDGLNKGECSWNCACDNTKKPDDGNGWECLPDGTWYCTTNINWCADGPGFEKCMSYCPCDDAKKTDAGDAWTCDEMGWSGSAGTWYNDGGNKCEDGPDKGKTMKLCSCFDPPSYVWDCDNKTGKLKCIGHTCVDGPDKGKCVSSCPCDDAKKPDAGDGWFCDLYTGIWERNGYKCEDGPDKGKTMITCGCFAPSDGGDGWLCSESGKLYCEHQCSGGPNAGQCSWNCPCFETTPDGGDGWICEYNGVWQSFGRTCYDGPMVDKIMMNCPCVEGCVNCNTDYGVCDD